MKKLAFAFILALLFSGILRSNAQDVHFTQFEVTPLLINPAFAGVTQNNYRFILNQRNQWASVSVPYLTSVLSIDTYRKFKFLPQDKAGMGITFIYDQAGDGHLSFLKILLSGSFHKSISNEGNHSISAGFQAGLVQRGINFSELIFPDQYNGRTLDNTIPTNQPLIKPTIYYPDIGAGIIWQFSSLSLNQRKNRLSKTINPEQKVTLGLSFYHLNSPKETFTGSEITIKPKMVFHGMAQYSVNPFFRIHPLFLFMQQRSANQYITGVYFEYFLSNKVDNKISVFAGPRMRLSDAIIFVTGVDYRGIRFGVSYDVNISKLFPATRGGRGGIEFSLIYEFKQKLKIRCPKFS